MGALNSVLGFFGFGSDEPAKGESAPKSVKSAPRPRRSSCRAMASRGDANERLTESRCGAVMG